MELAYVCNCIYWADASNESVYADIYFNFVKDLEEGSYLHLVVVLAKGNGCVVSACADCIGKIVEKTCQSIPKPSIVFVTGLFIAILISGFCFLK